jgi:beta-N-acetylhexosaminidase
VAACGKHFPGHGSVTEDSHLAVPRVDAELATLQGRELVPFAAAVGAGVDAVMTGHLLVPALDPRQPATTSAAAVRLLRDQLGFGGVLVTDALDMAGVSGPSAHGSVGAAAVAALRAGADLLCLGAQAHERGLIAQARTAVARAVDVGELPLARLEEAAGRVASLGRRLREQRAQAPASPGSPDDDEAVVLAAGAALRLDGDPPDLRGAVVARVVDVPTIAAGPVPWDLAGPLAGLVPGVTAVDVPAGPAGAAAAATQAIGRPLVVVARDLDRAPAVRAAVIEILTARPDAVLVDAGWPTTGLPAGVTVLRTHGSSRPSLRAAAQCLAGGRSVADRRAGTAAGGAGAAR